MSKYFLNSIAFFTMFRYALVDDKAMHITTTFHQSIKINLKPSFFYQSIPKFFNSSVVKSCLQERESTTMNKNVLWQSV